MNIPGYQIIRKIGDGGMAFVYLALQTSLQREVALKVLKRFNADDPNRIDRFMNEAQTVARLEHPNIVSVYDFGQAEDGHMYYSMPNLARGDLSGFCYEDDQQVANIVLQVCKGLAYAHQHDVIHRDVKPENILINESGHVQIADFGIAFSTRSNRRITQEGHTVGSAHYMSCEQARGRAVDHRSDIYSVGVVLYELLTGETPFHGSDDVSVLVSHLNDPIPLLAEHLTQWQPVINRALAKKASNRFDSMDQMIDAIEDLVSAPKSPQTRQHHTGQFDSSWQRLLSALTRHGKDHRVWIGLVAIASLLGTLYVFTTIFTPTNLGDDASSRLTALQSDGQVSQDGPASSNSLGTSSGTADSESAAHQADLAMAINEQLSAETDQSGEVMGVMTVSEDAWSDGQMLTDSLGHELVVIPERIISNQQIVSSHAHRFAIMRQEVTRGHYRQYVQESGTLPLECQQRDGLRDAFRDLDWQSPGFDQTDEHPITCVSSNQAMAFADWLSDRTGLNYRLPSDAEWRHVAIARATETNDCLDGNVDAQSSSGRLGTVSCEDDHDATAPVRSYRQNRLKIYDLQGNVAEWTTGCAPRRRLLFKLMGAIGLSDRERCDRRQIHGSSWRDEYGQSLLELVSYENHDMALTDVGFRLVALQGSDTIKE